MTAVLALTAWVILGGILVRAMLRRIEVSFDEHWETSAALFEDDL